MNKHILTWIDRFGLALLGIYAVGCALFGANFSETHITLKSLSFPVFIGEILIAVCLVLLFFKNQLKPIAWQPWQKQLWAFLIAIAFTACLGFYLQGALALRNAAMCYYAVLIILGYSFYRSSYFPMAIKIALVCALCFLSSIFISIGYFWYTCVALLAVLLFKVRPRWMQIVLALTFVAVCDYRLLFAGSRTTLIASIIASVYVVCIFFCYFLRVSVPKKIFLSMIFLVAFVLSIFWFADRNAVKSLLRVQEVVEIYQEYVQLVKQNGQKYKFKAILPQLYNDNVKEHRRLEKRLQAFQLQQDKIDEAVHAQAINQDNSQKTPSQAEMPKEEAVKEVSIQAYQLQEEKIHEAEHLPVKEMVTKDLDEGEAVVMPMAEAKKQGSIMSKVKVGVLSRRMNKLSHETSQRTVTNAEMNMIFRIFIWKDMLQELIEQRAILGVGFGKPQRSKSLEILGWGETEWGRDGWITPHNAYFHIIYRLGIIGVFLIGILISTLVSLTRHFIRLKFFEGIIFVSVLVYWFVAANFLVILELPHYAIPIWSMLGIVLAIADRREESA